MRMKVRRSFMRVLPVSGWVLLMVAMMVRSVTVLPSGGAGAHDHDPNTDVILMTDDGSFQSSVGQFPSGLSWGEMRTDGVPVPSAVYPSRRCELVDRPAGCTLESGKQLISIRSSSSL